MPTATLRSVGGSVVMAIPKRVLELVELRSGEQVDIHVHNQNLVITPRKKPRYTLHQLLRNCKKAKPLTREDREWLSAPLMGDEDI